MKGSELAKLIESRRDWTSLTVSTLMLTFINKNSGIILTIVPFKDYAEKEVDTIKSWLNR